MQIYRSGYKFYHSAQRNCVGVIIHEVMNETVVEVRRKSDILVMVTIL